MSGILNLDLKHFCVSEQHKEIDEFCFRICDNIVELIESNVMLNKQNLSQQKFSVLQCLFEKKNARYIINDSDTNLGAAPTEKVAVILECKRNCMT